MSKSLLKTWALLIAALFLTVSTTTFAQDDDDDYEDEDAPAETASVPTTIASSSGGKKAFSVGLSVGPRSNMSNLGKSIVDDGVFDLSSTSVANAYGGQNKIIVADKQTEQDVFNSNGTNSRFDFLNAGKSGGPLTGVGVGIDIQYDLDEFARAPFFVRTGFSYSKSVVGGKQERTLGSAIDNAAGGQGAKIQAAAGSVENGVWKSTFSAAWWEVPILVGYRVDAGKSAVYGAFGVNFLSGGFSIQVDADEKYVKALTTHVDSSNNIIGPTASSAIKEKLNFRTGGLTLAFIIGLQHEVAQDLNIYFEFGASGFSKTVLSNELSSDASKALTSASSSATAAGLLPYAEDNQYAKRIGRTVVLGGSYFRLGAKYAIF